MLWNCLGLNNAIHLSFSVSFPTGQWHEKVLRARYLTLGVKCSISLILSQSTWNSRQKEIGLKALWSLLLLPRMVQSTPLSASSHMCCVCKSKWLTRTPAYGLTSTSGPVCHLLLLLVCFFYINWVRVILALFGRPHVNLDHLRNTPDDNR